MMNVNKMNSQSGFSLVELMIVVAIIGILATIAIPNFSKFTGKARQSEAKGTLAAIYTGEKAFYAEWSSYDGDFRDIGYAPDGNLSYVAGFSAAGVIPPAPFNGSTTGTIAANGCFDNTKGTATGVSCGWTLSQSARFPTTAAATMLAASVLPTAAVFTAAAASCLSGTATCGVAAADVWTITNNNVLTNSTVGL
jgi:type IV pilus assembly protein PilA